MKTKGYLKERTLFLFSLCLLLIIFTIFQILPSAQRYEISIYSAYPWYFWACLIIVMIIGSIVSINQILYSENSKYWILGYSLIIFSNIFILSLPIIRSYQCSSAVDVLIHVGLVKEMISLGHFNIIGLGGENVYPILHIFIAELFFITGISSETLSLIVPIFFVVLYSISIYLIATVVSSTRTQLLLITLFGSLMMFGYQNSVIFPLFDCFLTIPLFIFLYLKYKKMPRFSKEFGILLIIFLLFYPFFHPGEGTILLMLTLLIIEVVFCIWDYDSRLLQGRIDLKKENKNFRTQFLQKFRFSKFNWIILLIIIWGIWTYNLSIFAGFINTLNKIFSGYFISEFSSISSNIQNVGMSKWEIFNLIVSSFGNMITFLLLATILIIFIVTKSFHENEEINIFQKLFITLFFVFIFLIAISFFFSIGLRGVQRYLIYPIFFATILNGLLLGNILNNTNKNFVYTLLVLIFIICIPISVFNTFPSPIIKLPNSQVTQMDYSGMEWFFSYQNEDLLVDSRGISQLGYAKLVYGDPNVPKNIRPSSAPVDHFGYNLNHNYGDSLNDERYYIDNVISRISSQEIFPEYQKFWTFSPEDFRKLDSSDNSVTKLYDNGEFWAYKVSSIQ